MQERKVAPDARRQSTGCALACSSSSITMTFRANGLSAAAVAAYVCLIVVAIDPVAPLQQPLMSTTSGRSRCACCSAQRYQAWQGAILAGGSNENPLPVHVGTSQPFLISGMTFHASTFAIASIVGIHISAC